METFSLLRYWRSNGGDGTSNATISTSTTTIVTGVNSPASETQDEEDDENDHGPFFDLEFSLPAEEDEELEKYDETENGSDYGGGGEEEEDSDGSDELKFTVLSDSSGDSTGDVNVSVSPADDLFFKGSFVPVDHTPEINSKRPDFRFSLMKSATKFRFMMLKFRKSKSNDESIECTDSNASISSNSDSKEEHKPDSSKLMTVKFKRHGSSNASKKQQNDDEPVSGSSDEKKSTTETMQRYFRKVKPLYVRVSKKYGEKLKFTGQLILPGATKQNSAPSPTTEEQKQSPAAASEPSLLPINANRSKQGNLPSGLRVVRKHFGKSWSASTPIAVAAAPPVTTSANRRDDSLLQQQDGIQSAILHCKRSFKASRDCSSSLSSAPAPASGKGENRSEDAAEEFNER